MDINEAIVKGGTAAALRYRTISGIQQDNEMPEVFLGGFIAGQIHSDLNLHAYVERPYTIIAKELGADITAQLINSMGLFRADVAVYDGTAPIAIIELKVFDEGTSAAAIVSDRDKMLKLTELRPIEAYIGLLVTDVTRRSCTDRVHLLSERLGCNFDLVGDKQRSFDRAWGWCFASMKVA